MSGVQGRDHRLLHVLQVVHGLEVGGTERVVADLSRHFSGQGFVTSVCCLDTLGPYGEDLRRAGIRVEVLGRQPGVDAGLVWRLRRLYQRLGVDLVHAHQYTPYFYAAAACLVTPPRRVVFTEHGRHQPDLVRRRRVVFNRLAAPVTAAVTAVSEFTRDSLAAFERIPRTRVRVIYNGVEPNGNGLAVTAVERAELRRALGLSEGTPVVLTVGRLDRAKDFETLVRAMALVVPRVPAVVLLVAGAGDEAYLAELRELAMSLGISERVHFLGRRVDVPRLLSAADVFALTSRTEAASMTILEAMRAERPVVATDVGGNRELIVQGRTGFLVPPGDPMRVAEALVRLLWTPREAAGFGAAGRARVVERFSADGAYEAYRDVYERSVAR